MAPIFLSTMLNTKNMKLQKRHENYLHETLEQIKNNSPQGSAIKASLKKRSKDFEGNIQVSSKFGVFFAKATSNNLFTLMAQLQARITRQLIRYKDNRHAIRERQKHLSKERVAHISDTDMKQEA